MSDPITDSDHAKRKQPTRIKKTNSVGSGINKFKTAGTKSETSISDSKTRLRGKTSSSDVRDSPARSVPKPSSTTSVVKTRSKKRGSPSKEGSVTGLLSSASRVKIKPSRQKVASRSVNQQTGDDNVRVDFNWPCWNPESVIIPLSLSPRSRMRVWYGPVSCSEKAANLLYETEKAAVSAVWRLAVRMVPLITVKDPCESFNICSNGGKSMFPLLREIILLLREKHSRRLPVLVIYKDNCLNSFTSHDKQMWGQLSVPPVVQPDIEFVHFLPAGFSSRRLPVPPSFHLTFSVNEVHWLSQRVAKYSDSLACYPDATEEERYIVRTKAAEDWENFLVLRGADLQPGGILVVSAWYEDPYIAPKGCSVSMQGLHDELVLLWRRFVTKGIITKQEFINTNFHFYSRTEKEFKEPFENSDSVVSRAGLELLSSEVTWYDFQPRQQWRQRYLATGKDDRVTFTNDAIIVFRYWTNSCFMAGLDPKRSLKEREGVVDALFHQLKLRLLQICPADFKCGFLACTVSVCKRFIKPRQQVVKDRRLWKA